MAMLNNIQYTIYTTADYALIAKLFGKTATGHYGVAYNLASKPFEFITAPLNRALMPAFMALQDDRPKLANRFVRAISAVCLVAVPVYGCLAIYARPTILLLYSESFAASVPLFTILCGYLFARSLGPIAGNVLYVSGKAKVNVWTWCIGYTIAAMGFLLFGAADNVIAATAWISLGAVAAYGSCIALALSFLGPTRGDYLLMLKAAIIGISSIAVGSLASFLPIASWIQLVLGLCFTAVTQLILVGNFYGTGYRSALSKSGLKAIFQKL
jgi:O-antigen/teichoic acid export membrane protein